MQSAAELPELASLEGELLAGKYVVESVLGHGGMGIVFRARVVNDGRSVAIKVLRRELVSSEEAVARFDREARASFSLTSEHVARVFDLGRTSEGAPFIVMEHLVGKSLAAMVEEHTLGVTATLDLALEVCAALTEAHARGIIHRDLKPANVFMVDAPGGLSRAKVLDFGIAKIESALGGESLTTTGSMIGTPWYMPPEQLDTRFGVTPKADVWSLGATMYNALTARTPYEAESFFELSVKVYTHEPTPIERYRSDLPGDVVGFVHACLQKDVSKRLSLADAMTELTRLRAMHSSLDAAFAAPLVPAPEMSTAPTVLAATPNPIQQLTSTRRMPRPSVPAGLPSSPAVAVPAAAASGNLPAVHAPAPGAGVAGRIVALLVLCAGVALAGTLTVARLRRAPEPAPQAKESANDPVLPSAEPAPAASPPTPSVAAVATAAAVASAAPAGSAVVLVAPPSAASSPSPPPGPRPTGKRPGTRPPSPRPDPSQNGALTHER